MTQIDAFKFPASVRRATVTMINSAILQHLVNSGHQNDRVTAHNSVPATSRINTKRLYKKSIMTGDPKQLDCRNQSYVSNNSEPLAEE